MININECEIDLIRRYCRKNSIRGLSAITNAKICDIGLRYIESIYLREGILDIYIMGTDNYNLYTLYWRQIGKVFDYDVNYMQLITRIDLLINKPELMIVNG